MSSLPLQLRCAAEIVSSSDHPDAASMQAALSGVAAHIVLLEETLHAVLCNEDGARDKAWRLLVTT